MQMENSMDLRDRVSLMKKIQMFDFVVDEPFFRGVLFFF